MAQKSKIGTITLTPKKKIGTITLTRKPSAKPSNYKNKRYV